MTPIQNLLRQQNVWNKEWRDQAHDGNIIKIVSLANDGKISTVARDRTVKVWGNDLCPLQTLEYREQSKQIGAPWATDAVVGDISGQKRLVVASTDRSISFFNVLAAENDTDRPDPKNCLGHSGRFTAAPSFGAVSSLTLMPMHTLNHTQSNKLVLGTYKGSIELVQAAPPKAHSNDLVLDKTNTIRLHADHSDSITQLMHVTHVGLVSCSLDSTVKMFDPERNTVTSTCSLHSASVRCMAYDPGLSLVCTGGAERSVMLWQPRGDPNKAVGKLSGHVHGTVAISTGTSVTSTATQHIVFTLSGHGTITAWDLRTLRPLQTIGNASWQSHEESHPVTLQFDNEKKKLITGTRRPALWQCTNEDNTSINSDDVIDPRISDQTMRKKSPPCPSFLVEKKETPHSSLPVSTTPKSGFWIEPPLWLRAYHKVYLGKINFE